MKDGGGKSGSKGHSDSGMTLEVSMLSGQDITDSNIMQYLGIIEQRSVEVCNEYTQQCAKGKDFASAMGPQTPMRSGLEFTVSPPAYDEFSDEEDQDDISAS